MENSPEFSPGLCTFAIHSSDGIRLCRLRGNIAIRMGAEGQTLPRPGHIRTLAVRASTGKPLALF